MTGCCKENGLPRVSVQKKGVARRDTLVSQRKPGLFVKMSRLPFSIGSFPFAYAVTPKTSNLIEFAVFTVSVIQLKALAFRVFLKLFTF